MQELGSQILQSIWESVSEIRRKNLGNKEKGNREVCAQRIGIIKKTKEFGKEYTRTGTNKVLRMVVVPGRVGI